MSETFAMPHGREVRYVCLDSDGVYRVYKTEQLGSVEEAERASNSYNAARFSRRREGR